VSFISTGLLTLPGCDFLFLTISVGPDISVTFPTADRLVSLNNANVIKVAATINRDTMV
jgi:hypothetical protein